MVGKRVVGVSYEKGDTAPVVVVKGAGEAADAVLSQAQRRVDLPIVRDAELVEHLYRVPVDAPIGKELFPVMATLLAHVLFVDGKLREQKT
ncbi:MAG TPA: EscU/YscU/HrcU family type III secretion system export apparatus switch protein [Steroidobacteraceae bacterium]|jgi:type III secretion system FlhB-like substrate exporter